MTDEPYLSDERYSMFKGVKTEKDFRDKMEALSTMEILGLKLPERLKEDYYFVLQNILQSRIGLDEYDNIRNATLSDWGGEYSLPDKLKELEDRIDDDITSLSNDIENMHNTIRRVERLFERIMEVIGDQTVEITVKDYVGDIDAEDDV